MPPGSGWIHEIKFDGYRVQAHKVKDRVTVYTRNGHDWSSRFATIAAEIARLPVERIIIDGEVVVTKDGRNNFSELQADLASGRTDRMEFYAFDLLYMDGFDIRESPLIERKNVLKRLLNEAEASPPVLFSEHMEEDGAAMFESVRALNWEGIVSKRRNAPYRSGRYEDWIKIKCVQRGKFPIVGFVKDPGAVAALYLGKREGKRFTYAGKVGTGFTRQSAGDVRRGLEPLVTAKTVLAGNIRKAKATWVTPKLFADVEYRDITSDGMLRHSSFKGLFESEKSKTNLVAGAGRKSDR